MEHERAVAGDTSQFKIRTTIHERENDLVDEVFAPIDWSQLVNQTHDGSQCTRQIEETLDSILLHDPLDLIEIQLAVAIRVPPIGHNVGLNFAFNAGRNGADSQQCRQSDAQ